MDQRRAERARILERFDALRPEDRTYGAYWRESWREMRSRRGFKLQLMSLACFAAIIVVRKGWTNLFVTLAIVVPLVLVLGYWQFRKARRGQV